MTPRLSSGVLLASLVLAGFAVSSAAPPEPPPGPSVTVVNTDSNPVPVTGTVTATLTGPATVQLNNSPTTPLFVAPAAAFAREPFFLRVDRSTAGVGVDLTVPFDKLLVIESISVTGLIDDSLPRALASLRIRPPGEDAINATTIQFVPIVMERAGSPTTYGGEAAVTAAASLTTRLYARPLHEVLVGAPSLPGGLASAVFVISGYLVPVDSPTLAP